jgi:hypothetical protein
VKLWFGSTVVTPTSHTTTINKSSITITIHIIILITIK